MGARDAVVIFSGGMDSAVAVYDALFHGFNVHTLSFNYAQRHRKELEAARAVFDSTKQNAQNHFAGTWFSHNEVDLRDVAHANMAAGSLMQADEAVPHGHYEAPSMRGTIVPNRNLILLSVAAARATLLGAAHLIYGAHAGDHAIYPDCTPKFFSAAASAISTATGIWPHAPFIRHTKADIAELGARLGVPFGLTWSCYEGGKWHCGKCGTCVERKEAFQLACVPDPTEYAA